MIAVDTNILVRVVIRDDLRQAERAEQLLGGEDFFVPASVWLELEWALRSIYRLPAPAIRSALRILLGMDRMHCDVADEVAAALDRHALGYDFADAFHIALSGKCKRFATFDKALIKAARNEKGIEVLSP